MPPTYSLVVPIFNEEAVIPVLLRRLDALLETLDAEAEVILVDDGSQRYERDRDRGQGARRQALPADQAVAQFRPPDRDHGRARLRRRPRGHRDGRGSAGPARSRARDGRQMEGRLRRRLGRARLASGRKPLQAGDGGSVLPPHGAARRRLDAAQRRRFPPGRSPGARLLSRHARARPVRARHVRLDRLPPGNGDLRSPAARRGREQVFACAR